LESPLSRVVDGPTTKKVLGDENSLSEENMRNNFGDKGQSSFIKSTSTVQSIERQEAKQTPLNFNIHPFQEDSDQMLRGSLYFRKISSCICPSSIPLEVVMFKSTYLPADQIEVMLLIEKTWKLLSSVQVSLVM
jgi:hypothetical protein